MSESGHTKFPEPVRKSERDMGGRVMRLMSWRGVGDGPTPSVDIKIASHVGKAVGELKHGSVSSKSQRVQKTELGIPPPHSSQNPECYRTARGAFATWSGALSRLGLRRFHKFFWGAFAQGRGRSRNFFRGCF